MILLGAAAALNLIAVVQMGANEKMLLQAMRPAVARVAASAVHKVGVRQRGSAVRAIGQDHL